MFPMWHHCVRINKSHVNRYENDYRKTDRPNIALQLRKVFQLYGHIFVFVSGPETCCWRTLAAIFPEIVTQCT